MGQKITQKDLNLIPKKVEELKEKQSKINAENSLMNMVIDSIRAKFKEGGVDYVDKMVNKIWKDIEVNNEIFEECQKKVECPHNVEDLEWSCEGRDSHKTYYICKCNICGLEINSDSV